MHAQRRPAAWALLAALPRPPRRPLLEQRIRERQQLRASNQLPPVDDLHRKPQHREGLVIPAGSLQHAI